MRATKAEGHSAPGFPIETSVSYRSLGVQNLSKVGNGRTIDISSKIITFAPERELPNGVWLQMVVKWPCKIPGSIGMDLILYGVVTSSDPSETTMKIKRHEFRTNHASDNDRRAPSD